MAYQAIVTKISVRPFPNATNLLLGTCCGFQVVIGKDIVDGQLGVYFDTDGQLNPEFLEKNNLVEKKDPVTGERSGGFFKENGRVKAIKLRGAKSEGFWCPLQMFEYTGFNLSSLKEGDVFDELNGHPICNKYITAATLKAQKASSKQGKQRKSNPYFPKHIDTGNFRREVQFIPVGSIIHLSEKIHGTSQRYGHVLDSKEFNWLQKFIISKSWYLNKKLPEYFTNKWTKYEYDYLTGTRNTVLQKITPGTSFYGNEGFRHALMKGITLHKGEILFGEIVGYTDTGKLIMPAVSTEKMNDKSVSKRFGKEMIYKYGQLEGTCSFYVYRITRTSEEGVVTELSWPQVVSRCKELGLKTVPHFESFVYDGNLELLMQRVDSWVNGENPLVSTLDSSHVREGVVVRAESEFGTVWKKHKGFIFSVLEGIIKEDDSYVDIEESN